MGYRVGITGAEEALVLQEVEMSSGSNNRHVMLKGLLAERAQLLEELRELDHRIEGLQRADQILMLREQRFGLVVKGLQWQRGRR